MVSLFEMMSQQPLFSHLTTSVATVDAFLMDNMTCGIYDMQTVPGCNAMNGVIGLILASHIHHGPDKRVVLLNCLQQYPLDLLDDLPGLNPDWKSTQLTVYNTDTFSKLLYVFMSNTLQCDKGNTLVLIYKFHEMVEIYRMELVAAYKETLLKFQIMRNSILISQREKWEVEGSEPILPQLPPNSDLLKVHPVEKFNTHLHTLINLISQFAYKNQSLCILTGSLGTKYQSVTVKGSQEVSKSPASSSNPPSSSNSALSSETVSKGKFFLKPSFSTDNFGAPSTSGGGKDINQPSIDSFVSARLVFFQDWYHNTQHYKTHVDPKKSKKPPLRAVFAIQMINTQVPGSLSPLAYFDFDNEFYDNPHTNGHKQKSDHISFIDLSASVEDTLSRTSIWDTQQRYMSNGSSTNPPGESSLSNIPSSPILTHSQIKDLLQDTADVPKDDMRDDLSVIEPSEDDSSQLIMK